MILDATAGNRTMWQHKNSENIIYIDIEKRLHIKPTIFCDNTKTPFLAQTFDTIFYDPPHGSLQHFTFQFNAKGKSEEWKNKHLPFYGRHYGWSRYKTRQILMRHIYFAQREFLRILKNDGLLWIKWNETETPLHKILGILNEWHELLDVQIADPTQTWGKKQTSWVCLCKKSRRDAQTELC